MTKLTLSADDDVIRLAKAYARAHHTSVSAMFARFIHGIDEQRRPPAVDTGPSTLERLTGVIPVDDDVSYDELRREALQRRHGRSG